jgi:hypothetical protein
MLLSSGWNMQIAADIYNQQASLSSKDLVKTGSDITLKS